MSAPVFIHVMANGDVWMSNNISDTPVGTIAATFRANPDGHFQKIGTISGTAGAYAVSNGTGKYGKEIW